jgi:alanine dehydrogenase
VLVLTKADIANVLAPEDVIEVVERAMRAVAEGGAAEGSRSALGLPGSDALLIPMFGAVGGPAPAAGLKLLTDAPANPDASRPRQQSVVLLLDPVTNAVEALLDGAEMTRLRTAAASAVATRHLSRAESATLGLIGAGALAAAHLDAIRAVRPIRRVVVWTRRADTLERFAGQCSDRSIDVEPARSADEVAAEADVICTLTPARTPVLRGATLRAGTHVNAVGAPPRPSHREIDHDVLARSRVVVDNREVALHESGAIRHALDHGGLDRTATLDELGEVIAGQAPGRSGDGQITLYNSVGLGIQDLATARLMVTIARRKGLGRAIDLAGGLSS